MPLEARYVQDGEALDYTPTAAVTGGQVLQLPDGRAAVAINDIAANELGAVQVAGIVEVQKTTSMVLLRGGRAYWDHSANKAHYKTANDRDFYLGTVVADAASADTTCKVDLNKRQSNLLDLQDSAFRTALVLTLGTPTLLAPGGAQSMRFSTTAEAQKVDLLSERGFAVGANGIVEAIINVIDDGDATAIDFNVGVANATHASDADAIAESCFVHLDGNTLDLFAESDDGTTEVAATDTTVNIVLGTPFEVWFDLRDPADIQIYVDGALVLASTVFVLTAATGPLKLLAHLEKSSDDTPGEYVIEHLAARIMEE